MKYLACCLLIGLWGGASATGFLSLRAELATLMPNDQAGVAIAVVSPEATSFSFVGNPSLTEATLFEYGSLTKVFTGVVLALLAEEGTVDLRDSLNLHLPEEVRREQWREVTLHDLATHSAGLPILPGDMNFLYMLRHGTNPYAAYDEARLFRALERVEFTPPGRFNAYSNFGFGLLGTLLARAADTSFETLLETRLFKPLGMVGATVNGWSTEEVAPPLTRQGERSSHWDFAALAGAGAARGSVENAATFLRASATACAASTALAKANCQAQSATEVRVSERAAQGLGWIRSESAAGEIVWHNGGTAGASSFLGFNVQTGRGLAVLANVADLEEVTRLSLGFLSVSE